MAGGLFWISSVNFFVAVALIIGGFALKIVSAQWHRLLCVFSQTGLLHLPKDVSKKTDPIARKQAQIVLKGEMNPLSCGHF